MLAGEGHDGPVPALAFRQVVADGVEVLDRALDPVGDHHRPRLAADPVLRKRLREEVIHHDLGLEADRVVVALDEAPQLLPRLVDVELRVVFDRLGELVVARGRRVVRQHVQDEALLDRLLHGVAVEGVVPDRVARPRLRVRLAEDLQRGTVLREPDQLMREPGDGVALAAACGVLDEVAPARAVRGGVGEQPAHHVELVVARPDLGSRLPAGSLVPGLHHLSVVLQDVRQALAGQHLAPQVVGLDPTRVGRIARAVVPASVEGQEPRRLAPEMGAETHLGLVDGEVGDAAAKLEQLLARIAVLPVLLDRVVHRLLGEVVLQLEGDDRQAVDEERDVERPLRLVAAVAKLPDDGEAVPPEAVPSLLVAGRRGAVEEIEVVRAVPDAVAQHLDRAPLGDLALQPRQELAPRRAVVVQRQRLGGFRLGVVQEGGKLGEVDAVLAVVVEVAAAAPAHPAVAGGRLHHGLRGRRLAGMAGQRRADEAFEPALGRVSRHVVRLRSGSGLP